MRLAAGSFTCRPEPVIGREKCQQEPVNGPVCLSVCLSLSLCVCVPVGLPVSLSVGAGGHGESHAEVVWGDWCHGQSHSAVGGGKGATARATQQRDVVTDSLPADRVARKRGSE